MLLTAELCVPAARRLHYAPHYRAFARVSRLCFFIVFGTIQTDSISMGEARIEPAAGARNLGILFDNHLDLERHIKKTCQVADHRLCNISAIRRMLTREAADTITNAFVTSCLDFCNSLLIGLPEVQLKRLQCVQNAARLLIGTGKYDHITPGLQELHWLPVVYTVQYKIVLLTYKALQGLAPLYLQQLLSYRTARPGLRSAGTLNIPRRRRRFEYRSFACTAPHLWNSLPQRLRNTTDLDLFKTNIKTHLFQLAFPS